MINAPLFKTFKPKSPIVSKAVQYYYLDVNLENEFREFSCFPHFNNSISLYTSHIRNSNLSVSYVKNAAPFQLFTPIRETRMTVRHIGAIYRIVIVFNPLGVQHFFRGYDFSGFIEKGAFFTDSELQSLFAGNDEQELTGLLDSFLETKFLPFENSIVEDCLLYINAKPEDFSVAQLSDKLGISRRHLNRLFSSLLGVSVKKFHEITLFRKAMGLKLFEDPGQSFTALAHTLNYYDQAHLNKTFAKLTHYSPGQFIDKGTVLGSEDTFWHFKK